MSTLAPLVDSATAVDWWFAFKFNATTSPGHEQLEPNPGIFGGTPADYKGGFSLDFAVASSAKPSLQPGNGYLGTSKDDPLGATFDQIYNGTCNYVLWNDQFNDAAKDELSDPWGHSKGILAWDDAGAGIVIQVSTPGWPGSGSSRFPRTTNGNTLGCVQGDDDIEYSQHFFALKLSPADVTTVLGGLVNASAPLAKKTPQRFNVGSGPANLSSLASSLGTPSKSTTVIKQTLSSGVTFLSKPSALWVAPWQLVSAQLGGLPLRVASWWAAPDQIPSTAAGSPPPKCWKSGLGTPGPVQIATTGQWLRTTLGLEGMSEGGRGTDYNHAKVGVSMDPTKPFCIFGDMNQQGTLAPATTKAGTTTCSRAQNPRGGTFYVLNNLQLYNSLAQLLRGQSAPT